MKQSKNQWKLEYSFFKNYVVLILLIVSCVFYTIFDVRFSEEIGKSLDIASSGSLHVFNDFLKNIVILTVIFLVIRFVYSFIENIYIKKTAICMKSNAMRKIAEKNVAEYNMQGENTFYSFFINDMNLLEKSYIKPVIHTVTDFICLMITLVALVRINWIVSLFVLVVSFIPLIVTKVMMSSVQTAFAKYAKNMEEYSTCIGEYYDGYQEFNNYGATDLVIEKHETVSKKIENSKRRAYLKLDIMSNSIAMSSIFITIGILLVGMFLALRGYLSVGEVFAISFISNGVSTPMTNLSDHIPKILSVKDIKRKYNQLLLTDTKELVEIDETVESIHVDDVTLKMEDRAILNHVSIEFEKGKKYVLLGESGSGKSTLLKLIAGFFDEYEGQVDINGKNIKSLNKNSLFNVIHYVPQQGIILEDSIRNNITVYRKDIDDKTVEETIKKVGFYNRYSEFENQLDSVIQNNGTELSGGEKQRISLARAIVKKNNVLFLDEATSALDHSSYLEVEDMISNLDTSVLISIEHRLEKVILEQYDEIIAMKNGQIVERGKFTDLIKLEGFFYSLYQKQQLEG